jgi:cysteinyl-tRNA synthetase
MLRLFNSFGKKISPFRPLRKEHVSIFTCGPSVYQRAHIGNFRTFLFEDILVRYLLFSGYKVKRGLILTDIEDKALAEAEKEGKSVRQLTAENVRRFVGEMKLLRMKVPDYLPRSSEHVDEMVKVIELLIDRKVAYWHKGNVYFDPLRFPGFGKLYGLDMSKWPKRKLRFHRDTYPGVQWNLGDFILWHGYKKGDKTYWDTRIGRGRPSWNIEDPAMIGKYFAETLSIYCGGIDNLYRHHDYTLAVLESIRTYPMAKFWLHCHHLTVEGKKMSKSRGNICYTDMLSAEGYSMEEIRFFLIYGHYRRQLNFSEKTMAAAANRLGEFRLLLRSIEERASSKRAVQTVISRKIKKVFIEHMDNDLHVDEAFDGMHEILFRIDIPSLKQSEASGIVKALREVDEVLQMIF